MFNTFFYTPLETPQQRAQFFLAECFTLNLDSIKRLNKPIRLQEELVRCIALKALEAIKVDYENKKTSLAQYLACYCFFPEFADTNFLSESFKTIRDTLIHSNNSIDRQPYCSLISTVFKVQPLYEGVDCFHDLSLTSKENPERTYSLCSLPLFYSSEAFRIVFSIPITAESQNLNERKAIVLNISPDLLPLVAKAFQTGSLGHLPKQPLDRLIELVEIFSMYEHEFLIQAAWYIVMLQIANNYHEINAVLVYILRSNDPTAHKHFHFVTSLLSRAKITFEFPRDPSTVDLNALKMTNFPVKYFNHFHSIFDYTFEFEVFSSPFALLLTELNKSKKTLSNIRVLKITEDRYKPLTKKTLKQLPIYFPNLEVLHIEEWNPRTRANLELPSYPSLSILKANPHFVRPKPRDGKVIVFDQEKRHISFPLWIGRREIIASLQHIKHLRNKPTSHIKIDLTDVEPELLGMFLENISGVIALSLKNLERLDEETSIPLPSSIRHLFLLEEKNLANETLLKLLSGSQNMREVAIPLAENVNDDTLRMMGEQCPQLETIAVNSTQLITDNGLKELAENCQNLKVLYLNNASNISDKGLKVLETLPIHLLRISSASEITRGAIQNFFSARRTTLKSLWVNSVEQLEGVCQTAQEDENRLNNIGVKVFSAFFHPWLSQRLKNIKKLDPESFGVSSDFDRLTFEIDNFNPDNPANRPIARLGNELYR